jgi:hypothetical protein
VGVKYDTFTGTEHLGDHTADGGLGAWSEAHAGTAAEIALSGGKAHAVAAAFGDWQSGLTAHVAGSGGANAREVIADVTTLAQSGGAPTDYQDNFTLTMNVAAAASSTVMGVPVHLGGGVVLQLVRTEI